MRRPRVARVAGLRINPSRARQKGQVSIRPRRLAAASEGGSSEARNLPAREFSGVPQVTSHPGGYDQGTESQSDASARHTGRPILHVPTSDATNAPPAPCRAAAATGGCNSKMWTGEGALKHLARQTQRT